MITYLAPRTVSYPEGGDDAVGDLVELEFLNSSFSSLSSC